MKEKFKISLLKNGIHSFNKGLDEFTNYEINSKNDEFKLKESIMFLHHGIELLLKQVLIDIGGEYLIYSDISSATVKKIIDAKNKGISVFNLPKPPQTATYLEVIDRIKAFVDVSEIEESLETRLRELNTLRNNLEHYGIDEDKSKVENLLLNLHNPVTKFFKKAGIELGDEINKKWTQLEGKLILAASSLRAGNSLKAKLVGNKAIIEYVKNYDEYKKLQPQSSVSEKQLELYWDSGDAVLKALNDGGVRLLKKIDDLEEVEIKLPYDEDIYSIQVTRKDVESFLGCPFNKIRDDWDNSFSNKYVYSKDGRKEFFEKFGSINN